MTDWEDLEEWEIRPGLSIVLARMTVDSGKISYTLNRKREGYPRPEHGVEIPEELVKEIGEYMANL